MIDAAFGWQHEAFVDSAGKLNVCKKPIMNSVKVEEIEDKLREDMQEISIPGQKVVQAAFTRFRLFAMTEKGDLFVFKINLKIEKQDKDYIKKEKIVVQADIDLKTPI